MKSDQLEKLRGKNEAELKEDLKSNQDKLWQLRLDLKRGKVKNVRQIHQLKKAIAVVNTLLKEKSK